MTKPLLKNGHDLAVTGFCQSRDCVRCGKTAYERLLANNVFPGIQRPRYLLEMEVGRCTDIDHVDIWSLARLRKTVGGLWDPVLFRYGRSALAVEVAKKFDFEEIGECLKALDMLAPDAGTDDCDLEW
jgi:hypothetical protein